MYLEINKQDFDHEHPDNLGRPIYFNIDKYLSSVEEMIIADEVERALWMLDNMPAYYRDNYPLRAMQIKERIYKQLFTVIDYGRNNNTQIEIFQKMKDMSLEDFNRIYFSNHRAMHTLGTCLMLNDKGIIPHIVEMGPETYWLPYGLKKNGIKFTYKGDHLNENIHELAKLILSPIWSDESKSDYNIFIAYEVIEHLHNEADIYHYYIQQNIDFKLVLLSTPKYTHIAASPKWFDAALGHLRAYTPGEFLKFAQKYFYGREWKLAGEDCMLLQGEKK